MVTKKVMLHVRIPDDLDIKVEKYISTHKCNKTELVNLALNRLFHDTNEDLIIRSLSKLNMNIKTSIDNTTINTELLFLFVRIFLITFPALPEAERERAVSESTQRLNNIIIDIANKILKKDRFVSQVYDAMKLIDEAFISADSLGNDLSGTQGIENAFAESFSG